MLSEGLLFLSFNAIIVLLLVIDMLFLHKKEHVVQFREALLMSAFWIIISLGFNLLIYFTRGSEDALNFLAGYLVEKSLSVDNIFVFFLIFAHFRVPPYLLHKILFWGVFGAIIMRAIMIVGGVTLIHHFHWIIYIFGLLLIYTGVKFALKKTEQVDEYENSLLIFLRKYIPVTDDFVGDRFFVRQEGRYLATPLFIIILSIEMTDLIFAVDSIPAILGITNDYFIIYTSNVLAILGLRSLYFVLAEVVTLFHYLHYGLSFILIFIGIKMVLSGYLVIPIAISLAVIVTALALSIALSLLIVPKR